MLVDHLLSAGHYDCTVVQWTQYRFYCLSPFRIKTLNKLGTEEIYLSNIQAVYDRSTLGFPCGSDTKSLPAMQETQVQSLGQEDPLEKGMATTPVFLPGEFHGQRSPVGCSPWGNRDGERTEQLTLSLHCSVD